MERIKWINDRKNDSTVEGPKTEEGPNHEEASENERAVVVRQQDQGTPRPDSKTTSK